MGPTLGTLGSLFPLIVTPTASTAGWITPSGVVWESVRQGQRGAPAVYLIALSSVGQWYVGQTSCLSRRIARHRREHLSIRAAIDQERELNPQGRAEIITFEGTFRHGVMTRTDGDSCPLVSEPRRLDLSQELDRLTVEGAVVRILREQFGEGAVLNANRHARTRGRDLGQD
jgi:hypothetical protein